MLDDLRRTAEDGGAEEFDLDDEEGFIDDFDFEGNVIGEAAPRAGGRGFLGMTAMERMVLSIFLFLNVTVLGLALLFATGRMG